MNVNVFLRVIGYAAVPLVMAWMGNHLAAEVQQKQRRKMYRAAFALLAVFGIAITVIVEVSADRAHEREVNETKKNYDNLRADNFYLRGKLDTISAVLGGLSAARSMQDDAVGNKVIATLEQVAKQIGHPHSVGEDRQLSFNETGAASQSLRNDMGNVVITAIAGDEESYRFAQQLSLIFTKAGWKVIQPLGRFQAQDIKSLRTGITVRCSSKETRGLCKTISNSLTPLGIKLNQEAADDKLPVDMARVQVWPRD